MTKISRWHWQPTFLWNLVIKLLSNFFFLPIWNYLSYILAKTLYPSVNPLVLNSQGQEVLKHIISSRAVHRKKTIQITYNICYVYFIIFYNNLSLCIYIYIYIYICMFLSILMKHLITDLNLMILTFPTFTNLFKSLWLEAMTRGQRCYC